MSRERLLYLAPWAIPGGADKGTVDWFRTLDQTRFEAHLITTAKATENAFVCAIEPHAAAVWNLPDLLEEHAFAAFVLHYVGVEGIRLVHIMNSHLGFDLIPFLKARYPDVAIVVQQHAEEADQQGYVRYVATRYGHLVDAYSATSHDLKRRICGHGADPRKVHVIYTGIDAEAEWRPAAELPSDGSRPLQVLFAGRLEAQKDPHLMLEVVRAAIAAGVAMDVHVVGDGSLRASVAARATAVGLADVIRFHGVSHEMRGWYERADALLMTSVFEGIPYVIFEAMAMGLPTVVPDVNANRELVDEEVGFVVEDREDIAAYVGALRALAESPFRRAELGRAARARVLERYPLNRMAAEHARLYEQLLGVVPPSEPSGSLASRS